jgi:hypothetical protein
MFRNPKHEIRNPKQPGNPKAHFWTQRRKWCLVCVAVFAISPATAPAQTSAYSRRLAALQQQNAFQLQQSAIQVAVQQTAVLAQTATVQNTVVPQPNTATLPTTTATPNNFLEQQMALRTAIQETRALLLVGRQGSAALNRTALGQLGTLSAVLQESITLGTAARNQNHVLTPAQRSQLSRQQSRLSSLLNSQPALLSTSSPAAAGR